MPAVPNAHGSDVRPDVQRRSAVRASTPQRTATRGSTPLRGSPAFGSTNGSSSSMLGGRASSPRGSSPSSRRSRRLASPGRQEIHQIERNGARGLKSANERGQTGSSNGVCRERSGSLRNTRSSLGRGIGSTAPATVRPAAQSRMGPQQSNGMRRLATSPRSGTPPPQTPRGSQITTRNVTQRNSAAAAAASARGAPTTVEAREAAAAGVPSAPSRRRTQQPRRIVRPPPAASPAANSADNDSSSASGELAEETVAPLPSAVPCPGDSLTPDGCDLDAFEDLGATELPTDAGVSSNGAVAPDSGLWWAWAPGTKCEDATMPALELQASAYTLAGRKMRQDWANQDAYLVVPANRDRMFVAVLDGHGEHGRHIAGSVCGIFEQMAPGLLSLPEFQLPSALAQVFAVAQATLQRDELATFSGTTAMVAIVDVAVGVVTTAHVGDTRLLIVDSTGEAVFETRDHQIENDEEARIQACGGELRMIPHWSSSPRRSIYQGTEIDAISVSRSLGDLEGHNYGVLSEPTIYESIPLRPGMALVAASDGVWETLPRSAVASAIGSVEPLDSARKVVLEARARWPSRGDVDDITAVVVQSKTVQEPAPSEDVRWQQTEFNGLG